VKNKTMVSALIAALAMTFAGPVSPVYSNSSQGGQPMVILNPGGGTQASGSDGLRMVFNGNTDLASSTGSDQVYFGNLRQWCCGGAGPVLAVGSAAYGEAGAARNSGLASWTSVLVSGLTGAQETVAAGSGSGSSTATGNAGATITYTIDVGTAPDPVLSYVVTRAISYVHPNNYYDETWTVTIPATNAAEVKLYIGGDAAPGDSDAGIGSTVVNSGLRSLREANPLSGQYIAYDELDSSQAFTHYFVGQYSAPYGTIASGGNLDNSINTIQHDAGIQVQWSFGTTAASYTRTMRTTVGFNRDLEAAPAPSAAELPPDPRLALDFRGRAGQPSEGAVVGVSGLSVPAGAVATVSLFAPEVKLFEEVSTSGAFDRAVALPAGLAPGSYTVVYQVLLPSGEVLALNVVIEIGDGGVITSVSENIVGSGPAGVPGAKTELSYTGVRSSSLPWWAIITIFGGLMLILFSRRAVKMAEAFDARLDENGYRTPWEILSTPIRVPGIDYSPGALDAAGSSQSLGEAIRGLDVALSLILASQIARLRTHA
jgi:hypothetical protein